MLGRIFPRGGHEYFEFFERHASRTLEASKILQTMLGDLRQAEAHAAEIKKIEHEGDEITHRTIEMLHKTFLTPIDRIDIHRIISRLDDILDLVDSTAERVSLYEIERLEPEILSLGEVLIRAVGEVLKGMQQLRNLADRDRMIRTCMEINRHENEGDTLIRHGVARLFREEKDPIRVMKLKEIYDYLEDAIDRCEDVANVLEGVALEYA